MTTPDPRPDLLSSAAEGGGDGRSAMPGTRAARLAASLKRLARQAARVPALRPTARRLAPVLRQGRRTWRRSLQLRMVTITLLSSSVLVGGFGYLVAERSTNALLAGAEHEAEQRFDNGVIDATDQLNLMLNPEDPKINQDLTTLLSSLAGQRSESTGLVVAMRFKKETARTLPTEGLAWPQNRDAGQAITSRLEADVLGGWSSHQYVTADLGDEGRQSTYLVYGSPVPTRWGQGSVELYYIFPVDSQVGIAEDIRSTINYVGAALVLLLGVVTALVTRATVSPVRVAARTAQRLSAGLLDQRMAVKGEDELALLADAFNQMAANLQRQIVRLEEMSRLQRRFTSDVSHELRTPLTTVRMAAELIHSERDGFDPAVARSAELMLGELDRFEELLTDLLEISRFDAGFAMLDAEPTDLVTVVRRVTERLDPVAERLNVSLELVAPDPPVIAEIDPRRVERILRNLVGNAVDHAEGRPVVVTLGMDNRAIAITVRDHGVGLKPGEEKLVFNRFWRADPSRARQTGGTGLGLSISLEDARLHGGWLEAWGAPGRGAQFRLTLPVRAGGRLVGSPLPLVPAEPPAPRTSADGHLETPRGATV
ncbi:MtrAB system histidine kinase MtrB [Catellatospora sp. KI3]|uniref:MtrAB system histidine kinase MtrB n=1 Tax=Catellatospora sp. KI3 TaxID=3041620 RepID=UPI0024827EE0|nr:MtrAB system histidine kinase MtrB [Catellatospora sp. KI3]MDI1460518.1 MtrAB system histidine kinase MtrB [Catellatospora sp. KI3]